MQSLVAYLVANYDGIAPNFNGTPQSSWSLRVDDGTAFDRSADFCILSLRIPDGRLVLRMSNLPVDDDVTKCLTRLKARFEVSPAERIVEIPIDASSSRHLRRLSTLVRRVVGRGRQYSNRNWKWAAPRASGSLSKLADAIDEYNAEDEPTTV
jgi:hypothetical protein